MTYKAIIFDMDGLMLDSEAITRPIWEQVITEFGFTFNEEVYFQVIGRTVEDTKKIFENHFGPTFPFYEARARRIKYADEFVAKHGIPIKPGLFELLDILEQHKIPKAVATSTYRAPAEIKLDCAQLTSRFQAIVTGDDVTNGKPSPEIFLTAAKWLNMNPQDCLVLEDSTLGIEAAYNASMGCVWIPDLQPFNPQTASLCHGVFSSLTEARETVIRLLGV